MVERDPALCELLNGDVGILLHLLSAVFIVLLVFLSSLPRVSFMPLF
jgi:hypothetical protein